MVQLGELVRPRRSQEHNNLAVWVFQSNFKNTPKHVLVGFDGPMPMVFVLIRDSYGTVFQVRAGELDDVDVGEGKVDSIQDSF